MLTRRRRQSVQHWMFDDVNKKARLRNGPFLCKKDMTLCIMMFESRNEMSVNKHLQQNVRRLLECYSLEMEREREVKKRWI